jgi:hypothetical protein
MLPNSSPNVAKALNKFESKGPGDHINSPKVTPRDPSPNKLTPVKPAISKKPSFTKADDYEKPPISKKPSFSKTDDKKKPVIVRKSSVSSRDDSDKPLKPVSVVQQRTQVFQSEDATAKSSSNVKTGPPPRPAPPARPGSRPSSVESDEQEGAPIYSEVNKKNKKPVPNEKKEERNNQYEPAWDTRPVSKLISSPAKQPTPPRPPPKKPPRTGAHDEYMQIKKQNVAFHLYDDVPDEEPSPVYRKIEKPSGKDSHNNKSEIRVPRPSRPPPPRSRPVTIAGETLQTEASDLRSELAHKPLSTPSLKLYEEVNGGDFSISNIKHWDLPLPQPPEPSSIPTHVPTSLKRSLSMDSLMGNPIYSDPAPIVNFRDDSEIYVDSAGYAMPLGTPTHRGLTNSASLDTDPASGGVSLHP